MKKRTLYALLMLGLVALILILNAGKGSISFSVLGINISAAKSIILLVFTAIGIAIGSLLR